MTEKNAVSRNGFISGALHAFDAINRLFFCHEMIVAGSNYPNMGMGREIGEVEKDEQGIATMKRLGKNMAWLLKKTTA